MKKIKVMTVFGTRPEAIKMAPLVIEMAKQNDKFESIVVVTAQHREMLDQVLDFFEIEPNYDLNIMKPNQSLSDITSKVLSSMDTIIIESKPDIVLVHGDTTTAYTASLASFYNQVKIGHVEAGLRTWNKQSPFPEEVNRQMIDVISDVYFCPTLDTKSNLQKENRDDENIFVTGNTVIDALNYTVRNDYTNSLLNKIPSDNKIILLTMHRRENIGVPMEEVFKAVKEICEAHNDVHVIYPMHLNPKVRETARKIIGNVDRIHLIEPLDVVDFHNFAAKSYMILSDSGGVQEEAPSLGVPVLVLRDTTERPEGIEAGALKLVGTKSKDVKENIELLLANKVLYEKMSIAENPYGDGEASKRILSGIEYFFSEKKESKPVDFK